MDNDINMDKYILKSEIKSCPNMEQYILKSEIPSCPSCPKCKTCPTCPTCLTCPEQETCKKIYKRSFIISRCSKLFRTIFDLPN